MAAMSKRQISPVAALATPALAAFATSAAAHDIGGRDQAFVRETHEAAPGPFIYLGAKHMVTGYDHLLFLLGVIFFLRRFREIVLYVSLFSLGHSITLLTGVLFGFGANAFLVDAVIGLSVIYKAFDNLRGFESLFGWRPDPRWMVLGFGLIHGLGLATNLEQLQLNRDGLVINLVSFNIGVELGQVIALSLILALMVLWRRASNFAAGAVIANWLIMVAGVVLTGWQLTGYFLGRGI
jgi:HupE / UreJ protein